MDLVIQSTAIALSILLNNGKGRFRFYQSEAYVSHTDTKKGLVNRLYHLVRNITLKSKRAMVQKATGQKTGNLLDVGAGTGAFAGVMQAAGWQTTGLEPDDTARANAKTQA